MSKPTHILVVDDYDEIRETLRLILEGMGHHVSTARSAEEARPLLLENAPDLMITDGRLWGEGGPQLAAHAKTLNIPCILMSADLKLQSELDEGDLPFLRKPFRVHELAREIEKILAKIGRADAVEH